MGCNSLQSQNNICKGAIFFVIKMKAMIIVHDFEPELGCLHQFSSVISLICICSLMQPTRNATLRSEMESQLMEFSFSKDSSLGFSTPPISENFGSKEWPFGPADSSLSILQLLLGVRGRECILQVKIR